MDITRDPKDETQDRSSDEKAACAVFDPANIPSMPPDPDEDKSAAEKAEIVGSLCFCTHYPHRFL